MLNHGSFKCLCHPWTKHENAIKAFQTPLAHAEPRDWHNWMLRNIFWLRAAEDKAALESITRAQSLPAVLSSWNSYRRTSDRCKGEDLCHSSHLSKWY